MICRTEYVEFQAKDGNACHTTKCGVADFWKSVVEYIVRKREEGERATMSAGRCYILIQTVRNERLETNTKRPQAAAYNTCIPDVRR